VWKRERNHKFASYITAPLKLSTLANSKGGHSIDLLLMEAQSLFEDCDPDEIYIILQAAAAIKKSIRIRKLKRVD
jgi:hypothetical protein